MKIVLNLIRSNVIHPSQIVVHIEGNSSKGGPEPTKRGSKKEEKRRTNINREKVNNHLNYLLLF